MSPEVFAAFDDICRTERVTGDVLEIGATPGADTLLRLPSLRASGRRTGIDLQGGYRDQAIEIVEGNANDMHQFADASFDAVLCNSVLEHDAAFWLTLKEIRRVVRPGGLIVIGVPGFGAMKSVPHWRWVRLASRLPLLGRRLRLAASGLGVSAPTLGLHQFPGDYYRFSEAAVREVFLAGLMRPQVTELLTPPRFIGWGRMP